MTEEQLKIDVSNGLSLKQIGEKYNVSKNTVLSKLNQYGLKTNHQSKCFKSHIKYDDNDWEKIQQFYDSGNTWRDIVNHFSISSSTLHKAQKLGKLKLRTLSDSLLLRYKKYGGRKLTEETKQKISRSRIKYLQENPDKVPYIINHSSKKSYPEEVFEKALVSSGITGWKYKHRHGIYEYDFAFVDEKIDIEIDGGTHSSEKVKKIDDRRDTFSKEHGWTVVRFTAKTIKKDVVSCINVIKSHLSSKI